MGWLIALIIFGLLMILPLGVSARYDFRGALVCVIAGPIRIQVFPRKKKKEKKKQASKVNKTTEKPAASQKSSDGEVKKGGSVTDFLPLVYRVLDFLGDLRRKLRIDRLELKLVMAGDDPCDLAVNYGRAWAAVGNLFPLLERCFVIKKRDVTVECDFTGDKILVFARVDITITVARIFSLGIRHGIRILRDYLKIMKLRKGGASE